MIIETSPLIIFSMHTQSFHCPKRQSDLALFASVLRWLVRQQCSGESEQIARRDSAGSIRELSTRRVAPSPAARDVASRRPQAQRRENLQQVPQENPSHGFQLILHCLRLL